MDHSSVPICVIGAGTMGRGIAQVALMAGHTVSLIDPDPRQLAAARDDIVSRIRKKNEAAAEVADRHLNTHAQLAEAAPEPDTVVVEAILENLDIKQSVLRQAAQHFGPTCVLATNTSSLSVTAIAAGVPDSSRTVGMHFFNPVPVMKLVEIVRGLQTDDAVVDIVTNLAEHWGKTVAQVRSTPGFIVNRVARGFYGEALRCLQEGIAAPETVDEVVRGAGGFRMGPFELMDLIGNDVNSAVNREVWAAYNFDPRFAPSLVQDDLVAAGRFGRKSGRGFYDYAGGASRPTPPAVESTAKTLPELVLHGHDAQLETLLERAGATFEAKPASQAECRLELVDHGVVVVTRGLSAAEESRRHGVPALVLDRCLSPAHASAVAIASTDSKLTGTVAHLLAKGGVESHAVRDLPALVLARTLAVIANEAWETEHHGVASAADIDLAMRLGTNYPLGPFEWTALWTPQYIVTLLDALWEAYHDPRYRVSQPLRAAAQA